MGSQQWCTKDTRDLRMSSTINFVNEIPVVKGNLNFTNQQTFKKVQRAAIKFCEQRNLGPQYIPTVARIIAYRHDNLFEAYRKLPEQQREQFMDDLMYLDIEFTDSLYHNLIIDKRQSSDFGIMPTKVPVLDYQKMPLEKYQIIKQVGDGLIRQKRIAVVFMCAGSSSRFYGQDKFLCPLDIPSKRCILQLMFDRLKKNLLNAQAQLSLPILIACNDSNRVLIENYLKKNSYFGFNIELIRFIQIENLPILTMNGKFCISFQYKILSRPAGTAKCLEALLTSTAYKFLGQNNIKYIHFCGIQNLLQNPCDSALFGLAMSQKKQMVGKCVNPLYQSENFPRYVLKQKRIALADMQSLSNFNRMDLLAESPIALNSIVFDTQFLGEMIKDYNNNMYLSKQYRVSECTTDYYNFSTEKPQIKTPCYVFEKDICDLFYCCRKGMLLRIPKWQFAPLITKYDEYSMKMACNKYMEAEKIQSSLVNRIF